jgi:hypothetical protein
VAFSDRKWIDESLVAIQVAESIMFQHQRKGHWLLAVAMGEGVSVSGPLFLIEFVDKILASKGCDG